MLCNGVKDCIHSSPLWYLTNKISMAHHQLISPVDIQQPPMGSPHSHDVFISHSGVQKSLALDLRDVLTRHGISTFLDTGNEHSLPLAEPFPFHIFKAASSCKLAVVVVTEEYLTSKWPMYELCAFKRASPLVKILPIFLHLQPEGLNNEQNLQRWRKQWESFAEKEPERINVKEWVEALQLLRSCKGLIYNPRLEGHLSFIEKKILSPILRARILSPHDGYDINYMQGEARLRQIVLIKLEEMESSCRRRQQDGYIRDPSLSQSPESIDMACILCIHGILGSGKSTLCKVLKNHFLYPYAGKSLHLNLPTDPTHSTLLQSLKRLLSLVTLHVEMDQVSDIDQIISDKRKVVEEMLLPCLLTLVPVDEQNCIDFKQWEDEVEQKLASSECFGLSNYVNEMNMIVSLKQSDPFVGSSKPKEVLLQHLNTVALIFCQVLDECRSYGDRRRRRAYVDKIAPF